MKNSFIREKPVNLILLLSELEKRKEPAFILLIAKRTDMAFSHAHKLICLFEKEDIITTEKEGRTRLLSLTKKGRELAKHLENINTLTTSK